MAFSEGTSGRLSSSSEPTFDAQSPLDLPILEVEATDLLDAMKP
jgi:hypothetical protein